MLDNSNVKKKHSYFDYMWVSKRLLNCYRAYSSKRFPASPFLWHIIYCLRLCKYNIRTLKCFTATLRSTHKKNLLQSTFCPSMEYCFYFIVWPLSTFVIYGSTCTYTRASYVVNIRICRERGNIDLDLVM